MKHNDFITSLKNLKSQIEEKKSKPILSEKSLYQTKVKSSCQCRDTNKEYKYLYSSYQELEYLLASKNINLKSYACPYEKGWHLTKG